MKVTIQTGRTNTTKRVAGIKIILNKAANIRPVFFILVQLISLNKRCLVVYVNK